MTPDPFITEIGQRLLAMRGPSGLGEIYDYARDHIDGIQGEPAQRREDIADALRAVLGLPSDLPYIALVQATLASYVRELRWGPGTPEIIPSTGPGDDRPAAVPLSDRARSRR